jgi:very-short-patch-repair endonuclease
LLILPQTIKMRWTGKHKKRYMSLGYKFTKIGDFFDCDVRHLPRYCKEKIKVLCDYCLEDGVQTIIEKQYSNYITEKEKNIIKKDCCVSCRESKKKIEVNLIKYGVEYITQVDWVREKIVRSYYNNGTMTTSRQQKYIHNLIGGELNYAVGECSLDIAFPDKKIYLEYDGGGHDYAVKIGKITKEEFLYKELKRYNFLKSQGWRQIKIISLKDKLPSDEIILNVVNESINFLQETKENWVEINIDKNCIRTKNNERYYFFGETRKITDEDIKAVVSA